ncbi:MAG: ABC transporter ATP-binding protein [Gammaproteobacteria bacterium]|nr:ABC transporter ATP-binding protein [Gammaproteobacteria bacterium]MDX2488017.1 ABC transporter ATP-binding protein [Gammaproteobacteria bacterium]
MITIESLKFSYANSSFRLNVPDFTVVKGEKLAVIGPSGSGKTTMLNLIAGIIVPENGNINVAGTAVSQLPDAGRRDFRISNIGFVFQNFQLLDYLSVMDNILHPYRISKALDLNKTVHKRAIELAQQMGIADKLLCHPDQLSQGEQQRAAICRALLPQPKLILADEATGNLDPENKMLILDMLFNRVDEDDSTVLAVTHDYELLSRFDRVVDFHEFYGVGA